jgi:hypothetical protein
MMGQQKATCMFHLLLKVQFPPLFGGNRNAAVRAFSLKKKDSDISQLAPVSRRSPLLAFSSTVVARRGLFQR